MTAPHLALSGALLLAVCSASAGRKDQPPSKPGAKLDDRQVRAILQRHCVTCHGPKKAEAELRLDKLTDHFSDTAVRDRWLALVKRVEAGEMPPKGKPRPTKNEIQALAQWVQDNAHAAFARRAAAGRVVLRRLNRVEYENTVRDLLGIEVELKDLLPEDTSAHGFDNVGDALHVSSFLMERYLEAADKALDLAIANGPQPKRMLKRYSLKETHLLKSSPEKVFQTLDDGTVVCFSSSPWNAVTLSPFYPPDRGKYRFRLRVSAIQSAKKPVAFRIDAGPLLMGSKDHLVGCFDAPADKPGVIEFIDHLEARSTIRIQPYELATAHVVNKIGADKYKGPGLAVHWVEVEGPLHEAWPPASHHRLLGELPQVVVDRGRDRREVVSKKPDQDARRILLGFARRAFRRSVTDKDVAPYLALIKEKLAAKHSFEQALRVGLAAIMVAPEFLFLREKPGLLDDFALASRLSYFLWSSMPDEELLALAEKKKLGEPAVLRKQVDRMLKSPRASNLTHNFVDQWLGLRDIDFTMPSYLLYPEYDEVLKESMLQEAHLFFDEVLKNDLSLLNFVASDFTMLNGKLARHYGLENVQGHAFRKVKLPKNSRRGGVLTMASVLKVTANGTTTSPVVRGAWVLDRILGAPPPPPPSGVAAVEPDIRGATTIREQLAKHRTDPSCARCHVNIDPPGFALESFDVIGGWRDAYRTLGDGKEVIVDGRKMYYRLGRKVDPADVMEGTKFRDIDGLKQVLLKDKDRIARALTVRLLTYATGGAPDTVDRRDLNALVDKVRDKKYGLRTLVHEIVQGKPFRRK
jgi:mono/diheme cytochrome c family protein